MPDVSQVFYKDVVDGKTTSRLIFGAYVDDCVLGGHNNRNAWASIKKRIDITEPEDLTRLLAVHFSVSPQKPHQFVLKQQMHDYCMRAVERYKSLPGALSLHKVDTPMIKQSIDLWQSPKHQAPGIMQQHAASLLMTLLYAARMYRADLAYPVCFLARFISKWTVLCDSMLHRVFCYVYSTSHFSPYQCYWIWI